MVLICHFWFNTYSTQHLRRIALKGLLILRQTKNLFLQIKEKALEKVEKNEKQKNKVEKEKEKKKKKKLKKKK